ncbi:MAG TPA: DUF1501 domain-containing protein [Planctomycetota bacterium]|nr:DUF1501 domain-containing protein [Planctomycetota bacterium]
MKQRRRDGAFDTHANQDAAHGGLLLGLSASLQALVGDLVKSGEGVLVLVFSEFERRLAENASAGTDHGTTAPLFLAWPVRGTGSQARGRMRKEVESARGNLVRRLTLSMSLPRPKRGATMDDSLGGGRAAWRHDSAHRQAGFSADSC